MMHVSKRESLHALFFYHHINKNKHKGEEKYEENGKVSFYAEIPFDAEAEIRLPGQEPKTVGAGSYYIEF